MKRVVFFLFLSFLVGEESFSSPLILEHSEYGFSEGLRRRHYGLEAEKIPFLSKGIQSSVIEEVSTPSNVQEIDKEEIFSDLGGIWTAFKERKYSAYFGGLIRLGSKNDVPCPEALFLLGKVHEEGLGKINSNLAQAVSYYTKALVHSEEGSPLYHLILRAYQRCQEEALRRARERD